MEMIYEFRKAIVADIGQDDKFYWNGLKYTIAKDVDDDIDNPNLNNYSKEELQQLDSDITDYDEYMKFGLL